MSPIEADVLRELDHIDKRIQAVEGYPIQLVALQVEVTGMKDDIATLVRQREQEAKEREAERKQAAADRKSDRKWQVGTLLAFATLVIAAMGVLIPALTAGPHP